MVLNCKICGGSLKLLDKSSVYKCEYCGKEQTIPKIDDEQIVGMLNRANHFRQIFEFDKAIEIYERVIENGASDADIYWALVLCRYGIEYVDDPVTKEKIPTCHRIQYQSILEDADYLMALSRADSLQRDLFEKEANYMSKVQKGILEISNREAPFDVFICYKESDENGRRTVDSVLAQDIYYQLVEKNYKVFFSRITLESKIGQEYEPYIFAALNSARIMIVLGTKPEYFNSVWVKNEWNRFLDIMHKDKSRLIIPAYKDFDPYDLPDELSYLQALDMSKIGFVQDLIRGIDKVLDRIIKTEKIIVEDKQTTGSAGGNASALLKRGEISLEDGEWEKAYDYYDQVLNLEAENSAAYLGQALAKRKARSLDSLVEDFEKRLTQIETEEIVYSDDQKYAEIESLIRNNQEFVDESVRNSFRKKIISWTSKLKGIKHLLEEEESWFTSDKNLNRALRFSEDSDRIKATIEDAKTTILEMAHRELEKLRAEEEQKKADAKKQCDEYYNPIRDHLLKEIELMKDETYIDMYCPECNSELSYLYWEIKAGELVCPMCDARFTYSEKLKI
mgnify:FL=1